jgi:hypothetical protein
MEQDTPDTFLAIEQNLSLPDFFSAHGTQSIPRFPCDL